MASPQTQRSPFANFALSLLPFAGVAILAAVLEVAGGRELLDPFAVKVLKDIGIAIVLAASLNIVNGYTGQFSLGHAGFMAVGGYTSAAITYYASWALWGSAAYQKDHFLAAQCLFFGSLVCGGIFAALAGYVVGLPSLRLRGDYLAIVTLGFGEIVRVLLQRSGEVLDTAEKVQAASLAKKATSLGGSLGFTGLPPYTSLFWVWIWTGIVVVVAARLKYSSYGRAFFSIREDEIAAEASGIDTAKYKVRAFVIAAFFAGIAGGLFAHMTGTTLNPKELAFNKSVEAVLMVVLGGMGSITGAIASASFLTVMPEFLRAFAEYRMIVYAVMLIVVMILRPQGLFGLAEISDLWRWIARKTFRRGTTA